MFTDGHPHFLKAALLFILIGVIPFVQGFRKAPIWEDSKIQNLYAFFGPIWYRVVLIGLGLLFFFIGYLLLYPSWFLALFD
jgi:hypothetical protein